MPHEYSVLGQKHRKRASEIQNWRALYAQKELLKRALKVQNMSLEKTMRNTEQECTEYCNTDKNWAGRVMHFLNPFLCTFQLPNTNRKIPEDKA